MGGDDDCFMKGVMHASAITVMIKSVKDRMFMILGFTKFLFNLAIS
jgi:hypothetical protein